MRHCSLILFICIICLLGVFCCSTNDFLSSRHTVIHQKYTSPTRRFLLSDATKPNTELVAALDGTVYLVNVDSAKPFWSFSSGPEIYSSYQAPLSVSGITRHNYIDCGDDGQLYLNSSLGMLKLAESVEEFVNSTPLIKEDGEVILGSKRTTSFIIDAKTGRNISTHRMPNSSAVMNSCSNSSNSDLMTDGIPLHIVRIDYGLASFLSNSDISLWNMTVAVIEVALLCKGNETSKSNIPFNLPVPCDSRISVRSFPNRLFPQSLPIQNGLPEAHHENLMLPASTRSAIFPSQPNAKNEMFSDAGFSKFIALLLIVVSVCLLVFVYSNVDLHDLFVYHKNLISGKKRNSSAQTTVTSVMNSNLKRKRSRKSGKSGYDNRSPDKEDGNSFWLKLKQPASCSTDGRRIGKLFVSNKEIAKGSNGTIVLEGTYEGRPVAVKRLVSAHNGVALKEIQNLIVSDWHPNIVRWYGVEQDQDFVYLALERCACSLGALVLMRLKSSSISVLSKDLVADLPAECTTRLDFDLWKSDGYPSPLLLKLMRDVISGIAHLHELGIVHRDLKPQNVLIINERYLCAKVSDMGISKRLVGDMSSFSNHATGNGSSGWQAPEQLLHGRETRAVDLFSFGCVLFYCITGGRHPFGDRLERDSNITKNKLDLFMLEHIPEAIDLLSQLLHHNAEMRPKALEVLYHPLFWDSEIRLSFLRDTSDRVELEDREIDSDLLNELECITSIALGTKWDEKMDPSFLNNIGRYRRYKFDSVRDLLRVMRNKLSHYRELPIEIQEIIGPVPEGFNSYFTSRFPKLLIEVYKVVHKHCRTEEWFGKYFKVTAE